MKKSTANLFQDSRVFSQASRCIDMAGLSEELSTDLLVWELVHLG
jgi:hypothetical protein